MLAVSSCLMGEFCRFNGRSCRLKEINQLTDTIPIFSICPELLGGLGTPREPAEIINGTGEDVWNGTAKVFNKAGVDVTKTFISGAERSLELVQRLPTQAILFKDGSPSCGVTKIHDGSFSGSRKSGRGVTTALLMSRQYAVFSEMQLNELLEWLTNWKGG